MVYEQITPLTPAELREASLRPPETDYPPLVNEQGEHNRLYIPHTVFSHMVRRNSIVIAEGPWSLYDHPNRQRARQRGDGHLLDEVATPDNPISEERAAQWAARGYLLTADTRLPINPRAWRPGRPQVLTTQGYGMFTHLGFHYRYGPSTLANLVLEAEWDGITWYLMTQALRGNPPVVRYGVPGGYVDVDPVTHIINETTEQAALREADEEGGFTPQVREHIGKLIITTLTQSPTTGRGRDTLFAWGDEEFVGVYSDENPALEGYVPKILDHTEKNLISVGWMRYEMTQHPRVPVLRSHRKAIKEHHTKRRRQKLMAARGQT